VLRYLLTGLPVIVSCMVLQAAFAAALTRLDEGFRLAVARQSAARG